MNSELRILLAEDNEINQHLMLRILSRIGYDAALAKTGIQVLNKMDREDFDVVLMDIQMPEMDGITATKLIRMHYPINKQPKIIALTAETENEEKYLSAGMDGVLTKPVQIEGLQAMLRKFSGKFDISQQEERTQKRTTGLNEYPTFDPAVLDDFKNLMAEEGFEAIQHVVDMYKNGTPELIGQIESASQKKDTEELLRTLHTLKGSSCQVGGRRMEQLCERLLTLVKQSGVEPFSTFLPGLKQEFVDLCRALDGYLAELKKNG